jgi:hypothetical protein
VHATVITRPVEDFKEKEQGAVTGALGVLKEAGIKVAFKPSIHQKFAIMDQKALWYGSINLLSFGESQKSIIRLDNPNISNELLNSVKMQ